MAEGQNQLLRVVLSSTQLLPQYHTRMHTHARVRVHVHTPHIHNKCKKNSYLKMFALFKVFSFDIKK